MTALCKWIPCQKVRVRKQVISYEKTSSAMEITVLPAPPPSVASRYAADKSFSQVSSGRTSSLDQYAETQSPAKFLAEPSSYFSSGMGVLTTRINQWIKTLDTDRPFDEEDVLNVYYDSGFEKPEELEQVACADSALDAPLLVSIYVEDLIYDAISDSECQLKKDIAHSRAVLELFCGNVASAAIEAAVAEIRVKVQRDIANSQSAFAFSLTDVCSNIFVYSHFEKEVSVCHVSKTFSTTCASLLSNMRIKTDAKDTTADSEESDICYSILSESDQEIEKLEKSEIRNRTIVVAKWIQSTFGNYKTEEDLDSECALDANIRLTESPDEYKQPKYRNVHDDSGLFIDKSSSTSSVETEPYAARRNVRKHRKTDFENGSNATSDAGVDINFRIDDEEEQKLNLTVKTNYFNNGCTQSDPERQVRKDELQRLQDFETQQIEMTVALKLEQGEYAERSPTSQTLAKDNFAHDYNDKNSSKEDRSSATPGAQVDRSFRFEDAFATAVVTTDGLTDEEKEHIERVMKMAQQSSFERAPRLGLRSFDAEYGQSFESYGQAAPLLTTTAIEEKGLATAPRFEDAFVTPTVVPTDACYENGQQSSFEQGVMQGKTMPEPVEELEPVEICVNQEPQISFEEDRSSATSGADADRSFDADYEQSFASYNQAAPLLTTTAEEEERLTTAPRFEEPLEHIERVMKMAQQSSFEQGVMQQQTMPEPVEELEPVEIFVNQEPQVSFEEDRPRLGLTLIAHLTPNMDTKEEEGLATAPRFEDAFVTPTVVPTEGLSDEEREHIERVMKMAQQSSFGQGVMQGKTMPEPVEELEPVEIFVNQEPQVSFEASRKTDPAPRLGLTLIAHLTLNMDSPSNLWSSSSTAHNNSQRRGRIGYSSSLLLKGTHRACYDIGPTVFFRTRCYARKDHAGTGRRTRAFEPVEIFVDQSLKLASRKTDPAPRLGLTLIAHLTPITFASYNQAAPLLTTTAEEEERLTTAPCFEDAFVTPTVVPTDGLTDEEREHIEHRACYENGPTVFFRTRCYARKDHAGTGRRTRASPRLGLTLFDAEYGQSFESYGQAAPLLTTTAKEEKGLATAPRFEDAFVTPTLRGRPEDRSSATSGADADRSFDAEYGQSFESYGQAAPLLTTTAKEEEGLATAPRFEDAFVTPTVVPTDGLTDEEREHIERVMKMAQQSSFEQGVMQGKTMPEPVEELEPVEICVNQEPQISFEEDRSSATSSTAHNNAEEEERLTTAPRFEDAFVTPTVVPTDGLTDEEREHIERVMKMAQQSSFEQGVMQEKTMPEPVEELEPVEISPRLGLTLFDAEYGQSFESYGQAAPLLTTTAKEEKGLATAPRFEDAFVTPTVVPTDGKTIPEPVEELEPVEICVNQEPQVSFEEDRSSATSGADADRSFDAEYGQSFESYGQAAPLLTTTAKEEEGLATAPRFEDAFVTPTVVPTDGLTDEEREHIERVMKMAQQSPFGQGVMQGKTMPEPVEELEPVEICVNQEPQVSFEEDRSSATSGADADRSFDAEYGQSFESYGQAAPLLTTTAEEEEGLATASRFEDAFVTPTVVPTEGLTDEEREHIERVMKMAQQSSFEQGVMQGKTMPEPVEELEPVEICVNQEPQISFEEDRSSATSGADADRSFDADYEQSFASYNQAAPLLTTTAEEEERLTTAPRFEDAFVTPTVVPTDGLTDEEREHIERVMKMAQQSSFEQGVMQQQTMPEPVEELEPDDRSSATSGADADRSFDAEYGQSFESYGRAAPLLTTTAEEEEGLATAPRFEDAFVTPTVVPTDGLTDEEREHIERVMKMAQQSSFEQGVMQGKTMPEPVEELEPVEIFMNQESQVSFEEDRSSATSGADADRSFDADYEQSFASYNQAAPLLTTTAEEEERLTTAPRFEDAFVTPTVVPTDGLTDEEREHIERVMKMAQQSSFEQGVMQGKTMPEPVEELEPVEIFMNQESQVSFEEDRSSATSGADADRSFDAEYGQSFESYGQAAPLLTTTAEEEEGLATASRFEDAFVTPTVVPTDGLTDEEREHIERVMKMAQQSSFEQGVMQGKTMPEPSQVSFEEDRSSATSGADADRSFDAEYGQSFASYNQAAPLLTTTAEEEERLTTAPRFEDAFVTPTVVPTDGLTDEEREHIERVMKMAQQSSFEQGVMQEKTMPEPVEELEPVEIFMNQESQVSFEEDRSSPRLGLTLIAHLTPNMDSPSNPMMAQQSSFEQGVMQGKTMPEPVEELEPVEICVNQEPQVSFEEDRSSATSGADADRSFDAEYGQSFESYGQAAPLLTTTAEEEEGLATASALKTLFATSGADADRSFDAEYGQSFESYGQAAPLLTTTAKEEEGLATAPRFEDAFVTPTVVPTDGLTDEEREHIERVMKMAQQSSFEQGVMQEKTMPEPVEELEPVEIFMNQESQVSFEEDRSSATSGADADRSFDAEYGQSFESYGQAAPLLTTTAKEEEGLATSSSF
ncbi:hypothetical protein L596_005240 [Steinernema carpocapsae]|uniref:Uncharacterized protein n=1 Tax=Steinernema carpocapsae TaxID=34508 RepID=A0A4U8UYD0_STECR|nr:hypothetical protein L596_005240 [Steinernema carpocapsae]